MNAPKRTVLFDLHQKLGARMTVFGGFEMPVSYSGIIEEHLAVRNSAGIFDLSHMGEFEISGPHALGDNRAGVHQFRGAAQARPRAVHDYVRARTAGRSTT